MTRIHLHPLGGIAGDMFVACLLDAFPDLAGAVIAAAETLSGVACRLVAHTDQGLAGRRFLVAEATASARAHGHHGDHTQPHEHAHTYEHAHQHGHVAWRDIRRRLEAAALAPEVQRHALGIFTQLAEAEGRVHGVAADAVTFHEVGAVDSVADIVAASAILAALGEVAWSVAPLPLGGGTVRGAHGVLPVPPPATALLLEGFTLHDDGIAGERVTPTGAAILRHLGCAGAPPGTGRLRASGTGFGTRRLPGLSNCLRALVFDETVAPAAALTAGAAHRELAVITFEVDDQSGEELAMGLEHLRAAAGVHDVLQMPVFGKKARLAVQVQVLAAPDRLEDIIEACFRETTTIGLRTAIVQGRALARRFRDVSADGHDMAVKIVDRPGAVGATAKAEAADVRALPDHAARARLRRAAEDAALRDEA